MRQPRGSYIQTGHINHINPGNMGEPPYGRMLSNTKYLRSGSSDVIFQDITINPFELWHRYDTSSGRRTKIGMRNRDSRSI